MRMLVACPKCRRQYDAPGRKPGTRFRCLCGAVVTVPEPQAHDARVVRCSSCGAPRERDSPSCKFCGADFTLHERDLNTVCPHCFARVSDTARFCHYCATRIEPELVAGVGTRMACPACGPDNLLKGRQLGSVAVMECGRCAGLWLEGATFDRLTEQAAGESLDVERITRDARGPRPRQFTAEKSRPTYRKCPCCAHLMHRRHFGRQSGVIIDVCRRHGAWFDADELPRILRWVRSGGLARAREELARQANAEDRTRRIARAPTWGKSNAGLDDEPDGGFGLADALAELVTHFLLR